MENLKITSDFENNGSIPQLYSCEGQNFNPELIIENLPDGTVSLAIIMDDPDAPNGTFIHWVAWNIMPGDISFNSSGSGEFDEGLNSAGKKGYTGPCPPVGHGIHHYHFKIYALSEKLDLSSETTKKQNLENEMQGKIISMGELIGLYGRG